MRFSSTTEPLPLGDVGGAWVFPEQAVLYTESTCEVPRVEHAEVLFDFFDWVVVHVPTATPPTLIHDWRSLRSIPSEVRKAFVARRNVAPPVKPARVIVAARMNPIIRMGIQTVSLAAQLLTHTVKIDLVTDPAAALRERGVRDPDPNLHARLRVAWRHARTA